MKWWTCIYFEVKLLECTINGIKCTISFSCVRSYLCKFILSNKMIHANNINVSGFLNILVLSKYPKKIAFILLEPLKCLIDWLYHCSIGEVYYYYWIRKMYFPFILFKWASIVCYCLRFKMTGPKFYYSLDCSY